MNIGVLGATGPAGQGLAARLASVGHDVIAGSRDAARAQAAVKVLRDRWGNRVNSLEPASNADAAAAPFVFLAVNWDATISTAETHADALAGKVVVSMGNGLVRRGREFRPVLPPEGSLALAVQARLRESAVVAAFQHVPAADLGDLGHELDGDVIVCGDDDGACELVAERVRDIRRLRPLRGGSLVNSVGIEAFAAILLTLNVRLGTRTSLGLLGIDAE